MTLVLRTHAWAGGHRTHTPRTSAGHETMWGEATCQRRQFHKWPLLRVTNQHTALGSQIERTGTFLQATEQRRAAEQRKVTELMLRNKNQFVFFTVIIFTLFGKQRDGNLPSTHFTPLNSCNSQRWAKSKPGIQNSIWVIHTRGRDPST